MLFDTKKYSDSPDLKTSGVSVKTAKQVLKISGKFQTMADAIGKIEQDKDIHFITAGSWALHDLLKYVLMQTGPADVYCYTWAVSLPAAQKIINLIDDGYIRDCYFMTHKQMKRYAAAALAILSQKCTACVGANNHSKGFILKNKNWNVSVMSSANFTNNPQIEGGVITCNKDVYETHKNWLDRIFANPKDYLGDADFEITEHIKTEYTPGKTLYIIRGLQGSGKSELAHEVAEVVFENDDYFYGTGKYVFDRNCINDAMVTCFSNVRDAMESGINKIAVANIFAEESSFSDYQTLAKNFGYKCRVIVVENRQGSQNIHGVSNERITKQRQKFKVRL